MIQQIRTMISLTHRRVNKAPSVPTMAPPAATPVAPTIDNSEEVEKQRMMEEARQRRVQGLAATDNTGGAGVSLNTENISTPEAQPKTLLGQ